MARAYRNRLKKFSPALMIVAMTALSASTNVWATAIPIGPMGGIVAIGNSPGTLVGVSSTGGSQIGCINWDTPFNGNASTGCTSSTVNTMSVSGGDTSDFNIPSTGTIKDVPQNLSGPITQFETISSPLGTVSFDLESIPAATPSPGNNCASAAVGTTCVPTGSPFQFTQVSADQVNVTLTADLDAYTGSMASGFTAYNAVFSTTLSGTLSDGSAVNIPDILNLEFNEHGTITSTWSATESPIPPVPEPALSMIAGLGFAGIVAGRRLLRRS